MNPLPKLLIFPGKDIDKLGDVRLDQLDKDEWREVVRQLRPDWTDEDFNQAWAAFAEFKRRKEQQ